VSPLLAARAAWRRVMPESLRRAAGPALNHVLQAYVRSAARAPHGAEIADGPIKVVGYFAGSHGIAASARLAARAFEALGVPVERVDASHAKLTWTPRKDPPERAAAWIFHLNPPELLAELAVLGPRRLLGPRYGYWAWELPKAPAGWLKDAALVDEVWAPSRYNAEALAGAAAPVRVVPHPLFVEDYAGVTPAPREAAFQAVALFDFNSSVARKNPRGAIKALGAQRPFDQGVTEAKLAAYGLLGKQAPPYVALPALPVTQRNYLGAWRQVYHQPPPDILRQCAPWSSERHRPLPGPEISVK